MKQKPVERTSQLRSRTPPDRGRKLRQSISGLWASQDIDEDGSTLVLIYVIACLVVVNLILRIPGAAMTLDQLNEMPLLGP
jgi:hypothetical protein